MYSFTACRCCMQAVRFGYAVFSRMLLRLYLSLLPVIGFISQNFFDLFVCIMLFMLLSCKMVFTLCCCCCVASVVSNSVRPHWWQPTRLPHPWDSPGKNTGVGCHFLLQLTTFCQTSPPWPTHLGWPHAAWLSFIELAKAVVHVIRLASCLWLWFQSVCPLMPSLSAYHLGFTLDVG